MYFWVFILFSILLIYFFGKDLRQIWFTYFLKYFIKWKMADAREIKKELFRSISDTVSANPELRKNKNICILEVGVGTGINFEYYPDGTKLIAVDPNPHFGKFYNENRSKFPNIESEEIITCTGEEMDVVASNSVDVVVMTAVMCSVDNIPGMLKQIHRVLAPGGKFYFMEHILEFSEEHPIRRFLQQFLTVSRVIPFLLGGCHLNRDMLGDIESVGFSNVDGKRIHLPPKVFKSRILHFFIPHLIGVATK